MEADGLAKGATVRLHSPVYEAAGWNCSMSFAYNMYGSGVGSLEILVASAGKGLSTKPKKKWVLNGDQGNQWYVGRVALSDAAVSGPYRVVFKATRGIASNSDIALDDIAFMNCDPDLPHPDCDRDRDYRCSDGSCISREQLCDFVEDCADGGDELPVECGKRFGLSVSLCSVYLHCFQRKSMAVVILRAHCVTGWMSMEMISTGCREAVIRHHRVRVLLPTTLREQFMVTLVVSQYYTLVFMVPWVICSVYSRGCLSSSSRCCVFVSTCQRNWRSPEFDQKWIFNCQGEQNLPENSLQY